MLFPRILLLLVAHLSLSQALPPNNKTGTTGDEVPASSALTFHEVGRGGLLSLPTNDGNNSTTDPTTILVAGGFSDEDGVLGDEVYVIFQENCHLPRLPAPNYEHSLVLTPDAELLSCGGWGDPQTCYNLDVAGGVWRHHSSLTQERVHSTAITLPSGTYIFGGQYSRSTSDFLPASSQTWQVGPTIPGWGFNAGVCGVKVSPTEMLLVGGYDSSNQVTKYTESQGWQVKPSIRQARYGHSCSLMGNMVVVAGGYYSTHQLLASTEIIPLDTYQPRPGGDLLTARHYHSLVTVGGPHPRLLAMGGYGRAGYLASMEEWDEDIEQWSLSPLTLNTPSDNFGTLAVPPFTICARK